MATTGRDPIEQDLEKVFEELEDDAADDELLSSYRQKRLAELQSTARSYKQIRTLNHGTYTTLSHEKEAFSITTTESRHVLVHFFSHNFRRCQILDNHLEKLARIYIGTRFVKLEADKAPFLTQKFGIQMLPSMVAFVDGMLKDHLVGFEEFGNNDDFETSQLEKRLATSGVLSKDPLAATVSKPRRDSDEDE